jgi:hypothetical protein
LPSEFETIAKIISNMEFDSRPPYSLLSKIFKKVISDEEKALQNF